MLLLKRPHSKCCLLIMRCQAGNHTLVPHSRAQAGCPRWAAGAWTRRLPAANLHEICWQQVNLLLDTCLRKALRCVIDGKQHLRNIAGRKQAVHAGRQVL